MCQGLTSAGGQVPDGVGKEQVVAIYAEGKEHALAIGTTLMTSDEMFVPHNSERHQTHVRALTKKVAAGGKHRRKVNRGPALDNVHCLNDGLWNYTSHK